MLPWLLGFLRAGKLVRNSLFDPSIHLGLSDVQANSLEDRKCFKTRMKCLKTDPFPFALAVTSK